MAQTNVFSFLQHKCNADKWKHFLIPCIGLSAEKMIVYMYDCVDDVLLGVPSSDLFSTVRPNYFEVTSVIFLWLLLNYGLFGTGVPEKLKKYKSGLH